MLVLNDFDDYVALWRVAYTLILCYIFFPNKHYTTLSVWIIYFYCVENRIAASVEDGYLTY